jgi:O-antigen/teichoic acid export membrane protein
MGRLRELVTRSSFLKNLTVLSIGTAAGQGLVILASPVLTRLYTPDDFGLLGIFTAVMLVFGVAACGCYEQAIVLPERDGDAGNLLVLSMGGSVVTSLVLLLLVALLREPVSIVLGAERFAPWLWLAPPCLLVTGLYQSFGYWCIRTRSFKSLSISRLVQALGRVGAQIGAGASLAAGPGGLIGGYITGQAVAATILGVPVVRRAWTRVGRSVTLDGLRAQASRYRKFPLLTMPNAWLNSASFQMPAFLLPAFFGTEVLGQYYLAQRLFTIPVAFFRQSLHEVFYGEASERHRSGGRLTALVLGTYTRLLAVIVVPAAALFILAPDIFSFVFGEEWRQSGHFLRLILPWLAMSTVVSPSTVVFGILNRQEIASIFEVVLITSRVLALVAGALLYHSPALCIGLYGAVGAVAHVGLALVILGLCRRADARGGRAPVDGEEAG